MAEITGLRAHTAPTTTFGFGVVFFRCHAGTISRDTIPLAYRPRHPTVRPIGTINPPCTIRGQRWHRVGGTNGFCGCSRRTPAHDPCRSGRRRRKLRASSCCSKPTHRGRRAPLCPWPILVGGWPTASTAVFSRINISSIFQPEVRTFAPTSSPWMGSNPGRSMPFTFIFSGDRGGAHSSPTAYQYESGTFDLDLRDRFPRPFKRAGLEGLSERQSADRMAGIFGWFLDGHLPPEPTARMWRNFPMIRSKRWGQGQHGAAR